MPAIGDSLQLMIIVDFRAAIYRRVMVVPQMNDVTGAYRLAGIA
jgi:hypothetical protein